MPALGLGFGSDRGDDRRRGGEEKEKKKAESRRTRRAGSCSDSCSTAGSGGGGRRSFGSDLDAIVSHLCLPHLTGRDRGGPHPDREKSTGFTNTDTFTPLPDTNHAPKSTEPEEEAKGEDEDDETLDPASHSFSLALRECQNRRFRSEALSSPPGTNPLRRRRPASLDLNGPNAAIQSPRFLMSGPRGTKSSAASSRSRSGVFPSPGTPGYRNGGGSMAYQKGWSSERVPLPANSMRRYIAGSALLPFNNGRALPSKWEDAEKWICSPVSGDGAGGRPYVPPPHHRRPKSKSGPLGAPAGIGPPYSAASPMIPCFDSGRVGSFTSGSPFLTGVLVPDRGCYGSYSSAGSGGGSGGGGSGCGGTDGSRRSCSANAEPYILRSASVHGWSEQTESSSSLPSSQDEKLDSCMEAGIRISLAVLRKDVATQMSPEGSTHSSPRESKFPPSLLAQPIEELESHSTHSSKMEVRDVQVDDQVTVTRWSKKNIARCSDKRSTNIIEWKKRTVEAKDSAWEVAETTKYKREEAKITAWENLQKAKAEAAIQKLEMKLEKKRSSSMDKILNKLRFAQRKAQEKRNEVSAGEPHELTRTTKTLSYYRRTGQFTSFGRCFCRAF